MTLREMILEKHSRVQTEAVTAYIGTSKSRLDALMELFLYDEYRVVQRSVWVLRLIAQAHPEMIAPHLEKMVSRMRDPGIPVAVKRNVMNVLICVDIPEPLHGPVMDTCFQLLEDPQETVAVRAASMSVLAKLAEVYPEIGNEIALLIEAQQPEGMTPGFASRARKTLQALGRGRKKES